MSRSLTLRWMVALIFVVLAWGALQAISPGDETAQGGSIAFSPRGEVATPPPEGWVSPKGLRVGPEGLEVDGTLLPRDVWRPRPPYPATARPSLGEIAENRRRATGEGLVELRLGPDDGHTQNETSIDLSGDTLIAGWNQIQDSGGAMGLARSTDRGQSWAWDVWDLAPVMSDPAVAAGGDGAWYFAYLATGGDVGSDVEIFVRRSRDDGATWEATVAVTDNTTFDDKPYVAASGDDVLVVWADFGFAPAKIRAARSIDGGLTWEHDTVVANNAPGGNGACPVIAADGTWYVFWRGSFQEFQWMARSTDRGVTWEADVPVTEMDPLPNSLPGGFRVINLPSVAAGPEPGHLVMVWNDELFGDPDILAVRTTDGGDTWSDPVRVNDDVGSEAQFFPWVAIDEAGVVHVMWYDRRLDGTGIDVYVASSFDGGASFETNRRVTTHSFEVVLPHEPGVVDFIGDYNALAAGGGTIYPFYQDARSGVQDVYVALVPSGPLFADGFESGDTSAWSGSRGGP